MGDRDSDSFREADASVTGKVEMRKVQTSGRVNIPDDFLKSIGIGGNGERVMVVCRDNEVSIMEARVENLPHTQEGGVTDGDDDG